MVYYFVVGEDGNRYGPADIDALVQWAREGRIVSSTVLVERGTERQVSASSITAIDAELRRAEGDSGPKVTIERDTAPKAEAPTITHPGQRPAGAPTAGAIPTAVGAAPPHRAPPTLPYAERLYGRLSSRSKLAAGLLGIFLGGLGIHRFYLGYNGVGLLMLLLSLGGGITGSIVCVPGAGCGIIGLWGFIEGIVCLAGGMKDADGLELC